MGPNAVTDGEPGRQQRPKRFGVRDLRNDTAAVIAEAERSGAVDITRHGVVVARLVPHREPTDPRTPVARLLDRIAAAPRTDTGWAEELTSAKRSALDAQRDDPWE